ncbi:MAG: hypothetical protein JWN04_4283 [Myxococcaceae bacterium]|nr:hypothetical protein [Myxococcaceae bacterium]
MRHKLLIVAALSFLSALLGACAPQLGDSCHTDTECSATGSRFCDRSAPGGYCTIVNCEPKSCGGEGVCVRFKPLQPRLASSWCMAKCSSTGDCDRDDYVCRSAEQLGTMAQIPGAEDGGVPEAADGGAAGSSLPRAEVLDSNKDQKFCVVKE